MAKAKSKTVAPVDDVQKRLEALINGVNELQQKTQIGIKLALTYNEGSIVPEIKYVDLIEVEKQKKENEAKQTKTITDSTVGK